MCGRPAATVPAATAWRVGGAKPASPVRSGTETLTPLSVRARVSVATVRSRSPGEVARTGNPSQGLFAALIVFNSIIGIVQELRAKRTLDNLAVVSEAHPVVVRDAQQSDDLSLDRYDLMRLKQEAAQPPASVVVPVNSGPVLPALRVEPPRGDASPLPPLGH